MRSRSPIPYCTVSPQGWIALRTWRRSRFLAAEQHLFRGGELLHFLLADLRVAQTERIQRLDDCGTDERVNHLLSAGTTYHGASGVAVQFAALSHIPGAEGIRSIWESQTLPPMVVAALPPAPRAERKKFRNNLTLLCKGEGQSICTEVGILSIEAADAHTYAAVVAAYGR